MVLNKKELIDLDLCVMNALKLFTREKLPFLRLEKYKRPLIVGSGNAAVTGKILFQDKDAVFADEGNYKEKLESINQIDGVVLISASGGKHAPIIAKEARRYKKHVSLITNTQHSLAEKYLDLKHAYDEYVFPKNKEPYTYNTSTYMGMILGKTKENPKAILNYLNLIKKKIPKNLSNYDAFFIIVPEEFDLIREMFSTKFDELFGPKISGRVFTVEQTKHAKTVVPSEKELFISFGYNNKLFGKKRLNLPLPPKSNFAAVMAIGYYVIGQIQKQHPQYFKKNIETYTKYASKLFQQEIKPIA